MKALALSIDFINDIVHPEGKIAASAAYVADNKVIEYANQTLALLRKHNIPIVQVKVGFSTDYAECPQNSPLFGAAPKYGALQLGTWGTEFHDQLDVQDSDHILVKHRVSALYATELATILRAQKIDTVVVFGVSTNMAIETITRELHDRDYRVIVVENACGAVEREAHQASINTLKRLATVCQADTLLRAL